MWRAPPHICVLCGAFLRDKQSLYFAFVYWHYLLDLLSTSIKLEWYSKILTSRINNLQANHCENTNSASVIHNKPQATTLFLSKQAVQTTLVLKCSCGQVSVQGLSTKCNTKKETFYQNDFTHLWSLIGYSAEPNKNKNTLSMCGVKK